MKARKVYENISFKRGQDPYGSLNIGWEFLVKKWFSIFAPEQYYKIQNNKCIIYSDFRLDNTNIDWIPDNMHFARDLSTINSNIITLPKKLYVGRTLYLNPNIEIIPDDIKIGYEITATTYSPYQNVPYKLKYIPDNLSLGSLTLDGCKNLTKLPDNLKIRYNLSIMDTNIKELPNNLTVGNNIYIYNTPMQNKSKSQLLKNKNINIGGRIIRVDDRFIY